MNTIRPESHDNLAERVLNRIKHEQVTPRPRWEFLFKNYVFWAFGALAIVLGALAFAATLFEIRNVDWRLSSATHADFISFFFAAAPIFWVVAFALLILIGYVNVRYTNQGYRHSLLVIALSAGLVSLLLGSGIYAIGFGRDIEEIPVDYLPFYRSIHTAQESWWLAPERGLLGGEVLHVSPSSPSFVLTDFSNRAWQVDGHELSMHDLAVAARGGRVRIVGVPTAATSSSFHACFVFPWAGGPSQSLAASSTTERNVSATRSEICKDIRPYQQLRSINGEGL